MMLGIAGAAVFDEAGGEEQAVRKVRRKKKEKKVVKWKEESLRMLELFTIRGNLRRSLI
jgi:hypothetical protein